MTYNPNIPQANDRIADSQPVILQNFQSLNTIYGTDHYPYDDASTNATKHKHITLPDQAVAPGVLPTPAASNCAIFSTTVAANTYPLLRKDGTTTNYQLMPIKAYALFTAVNLLNPTSLFTLPYANVSAITRVSQGIYQITFIDPLPSVNYGAITVIQGNLGNSTNILRNTTNATTSVRVTLTNSSGMTIDSGENLLVMVTF